MDLVPGVRKEGSRGGRDEFKWEDVKSSIHRENYLGHSLKAPVGRWQKRKDLNWYARGEGAEDGGETAPEKAARERKEEIKRIKEAEQDALAKALGYDVPARNPNLESLGDRKEMDKILKEAVQDESNEVGQGLGYGSFVIHHGDSAECIQGDTEHVHDARVDRSRKDRHGKSHRERRRSRSPSRNRDNHRRERDRHQDEYSRRPRATSRTRTRVRRLASHDRTRHGRDDQDRRNYRRQRSRSPYKNDRTTRTDDYHERRR